MWRLPILLTERLCGDIQFYHLCVCLCVVPFMYNCASKMCLAVYHGKATH